MRVHLVNPSELSFGTAVITPRWLYVLAAATPRSFGDPVITDETLETFDFDQVQPGDVVGIGIHTANALRGYAIGRLAKQRGATVIYGGIHATLYPDEAREHGEARRRRQGRRRTDLVESARGRVGWLDPTDLRGRSRGTRLVHPGALGSAAQGPLHVGIRADGARVSEALLVLLGLADGWPEAPAARPVRCGRRNRDAATHGIPVHPARRRQLLPGDARRSGDGEAEERHAGAARS